MSPTTGGVSFCDATKRRNFRIAIRPTIFLAGVRTRRPSGGSSTSSLSPSATPIALADSAGNRTASGDMYASLTVTTLNNGPYYLQAKLTVPFTDKNKPSIVNTVQALTPLGTYVSLSTTTWVNVGTGPGGTGKLNNVQLLVLWGKSSSKDPKQIPEIKLSFQVVPK